jgi:hypothetical protein
MEFVYKVVFCFLILSYCTFSIELSFIASLLALPFGLKLKIDTKIFYVSVLLGLILIIGVVKSFFNDIQLMSLIKDIVYFLRPILMLLSTYLIVSKIKSARFAFDAVVSIALLMAIYHLFEIVSGLNNLSDYSALRSVAGKQNHIEVIALVFLLFSPFYKKEFIKNKLILYLVFLIITCSVIFYFSRSMYIILIIFFLSYKGYLFFGRRLIKGGLILGVLLISLFFFFKNIDFKKDATTTNSFSYKIYNSISEIFENVNTLKIKNDKMELWKHWRAYESQIAIENILDSDNYVSNFIFGMGFGKAIDLRTDVKLAGTVYRRVPTIHNGYINIFYKTGLVGLLLYLLIIVINYLNISSRSDYNLYMKSLMIGSLFYILYNSLVITGFLRPGEFSLVVFTIAIATNKKMSVDEKEI